MDDKFNRLDDKIKELESKLIEQEHRPYSLVKNYVNRTKWDKDDPRRRSVKIAFLWRLLYSPGVVAAGGGLIGIITVFFLWKQDKVLRNQNALIENQNIQIKNQTQLIEADRRSAQMFILGDVLSDLNTELRDENNILDSLTNTLQGRIIALSKAMKPYKFLENDKITTVPISPERGQLFIALMESKLNEADREYIFRSANFNYADLAFTSFSDIPIEGLTLHSADFIDAKFFKNDLNQVTIRSSDLVLTKFYRVDFVDCLFEKSDLSTARFDSGTFNSVEFTDCDLREVEFLDFEFKNVIFHRTKVDSSDWLIRLKDKGVKLDLNTSNRHYVEKRYNAESKDSIYTIFNIDKRPKPLLNN